MRSRSAFTLIELLVVIAIIAILAVVVVLTLNPAQLLAQSRDANRVSDMATLNSALNLYTTDQAGASSFSLGTSTNVYVSIADSSSTCGDLGLPALPAGYSYACASGNRSANGTGWIPVDFQNISSGSPFGSLPVDPVNQTSSGLYYTYSPSNGQFMVTAVPESAKQKAALAANPVITGYPDVLAQGSSLAISPLWNPNGLVGWWPLNEGTGTAALDQSGNGDNGTWSGTPAGANGTYYSTGKVGPWAGYFNLVNDCVTIPSSTSLLASNITVSFWMKATGAVFSNYGGAQERTSSNVPIFILGPNGGTNIFAFYVNTSHLQTPISSPSQWNFYAGTFNGSSYALYVNGVAAASGGNPGPPQTPGSMPTNIGCDPQFGRYTSALINDVRLYNRALSAAEVMALYNAEK